MRWTPWRLPVITAPFLEVRAAAGKVAAAVEIVAAAGEELQVCRRMARGRAGA